MLVLVAISSAVFFAAGCGGSDASFSPDPSVGENPVAPAPGQTPGGGDGDVGGTQAGEVVTTDCFENGFCKRECATANDCPAGFSCVVNMCTFDCQSDAECGKGGACNEQGLCEVAGGDPIPPCSLDSECGTGRSCNAQGACEKIAVAFGCMGDVDCPQGQYCDSTHQCELYPAAGVSCAADADCVGNYYCNASNLCQQDCRADSQCAADQACDQHGRCVNPGAPAKLVSFSFNALGADTDPAGPVVFKSPSFTIDRAEISPAGRNDILTSTRFKLIGSAGF